jgi:hypothetical protein
MTDANLARATARQGLAQIDRIHGIWKRATSLRMLAEKSYGLPSTSSLTMLALPITKDSGAGASNSRMPGKAVSEKTISPFVRISVQDLPSKMSLMRRCPAGMAALGLAVSGVGPAWAEVARGWAAEVELVSGAAGGAGLSAGLPRAGKAVFCGGTSPLHGR